MKKASIENMKCRLFTFVATLYFCSIAVAQSTIDDKELSSLIDVVKMLRVSSETNFNKATELLTSDTRWTPMDETGAVRDRKECKASEKVPGFKLNRILSKVNGNRKYVSTHGDMVNGEDFRYDYSLYERAIKGKTEVKYQLKGREGKQVFVIVPFNASAKINVTIECNGKSVSGKRNPDGSVIVSWCKDVPSRTQTFILSIRNNDSSSQSFVIINHNTRKK